MMAGRMTIERLAEMSQEQFLILENKIDGVEHSLRADMERGFQAVMDRMDAGFASIKMVMRDELVNKKDFYALEYRVESIEKHLKLKK